MISFYFDQHVPISVARGLRLRGVDVLTAFEDGRAALDDDAILQRAGFLNRALVTQDEDFLVIANEHLATGRAFTAIIYAHQLRIGIGRFIADLELIAKACELSQLMNRVEHLPL